MREYDKITELNLDLILEDVKEYLPIYLFNGKLTNSFDLNMHDLFDLSGDDIKKLKTMHFILSRPVRELISSLHIIVRNLSHTTNCEHEESENHIKGAIDWGLTYKHRLSKGYANHTIFVCNTTSKFYDLEENQLLKFILKKIIYLSKKYLKFINFNDFNIEKFDKDNLWYEKVIYMISIVEKYINKVYFDEISNISTVNYKHKRKCIKNRNHHYHLVVQAYQIYESLFIKNDEEILKEMINSRVIKSINPDKALELYVFFNLIKASKIDLNSLLYSGNDYFPQGLLDDGTFIKIYYQKTPNQLKKVSKYLKILDNYDINKNVRSPDIIIEFEKDNEIDFRIIEVKNPGKKGYIRDSLYKVMGYYHDFEKINCYEEFIINYGFTDKFPIVLFVWDNISVKENYNIFENDKIIIINDLMFKENIDKLVRL